MRKICLLGWLPDYFGISWVSCLFLMVRFPLMGLKLDFAPRLFDFATSDVGSIRVIINIWVLLVLNWNEPVINPYNKLIMGHAYFCSYKVTDILIALLRPRGTFVLQIIESKKLKHLNINFKVYTKLYLVRKYIDSN